MFRTIQDFLTVWKEERASTVKIFSTLTDDVLSQKKNEHVRSLGRLAGHITETLREMPHRAGLSVEYKEELLNFSSVAEMVGHYGAACDVLEKKVAAEWTDAMLDQTVPMYGEEWKRGMVLLSLVTHQAHHRAQMTVLMRLVGLKVPGVYGPSYEEWSAFGMPAME